MMKQAKAIIFILLLGLLCLPAVQGYFTIFHEAPLDGAFEDAEKAMLNKETWMNGEFQAIAEPWLEDHIGFHNSLIRVNNQLNYSLFHIPRAESVIRGKNGQLYEFDYIRAWMGLDFVGEKLLDKKMRQLRFLQDKLYEDYNIDLVLVLEPGKASVYPEDIPDKYLKAEKGYSNYDYICQRAAELEIKMINLNEYFINIKDTVPYPLFPLQGTHWSEFSMWYAVDTMMRYIESVRGIDLPDVITDSVEISQDLRSTDYDIGKSLNLLWELKHVAMPYPSNRFYHDSTNHKPNVLAVADSYYWNIYNALIPKNVFNNESFWYFYNHVYPEFWKEKTIVADLNVKQEIEKQEVIFLMMTERFLYKFDRGFVDDLYAIYGFQNSRDILTRNKTDILNLESWFNEILERADEKGISLSEMLDFEAKYILFEKDPETFYSIYGPAPTMQGIKDTPEWYAQVQEKARKNNMNLEDRLYEEARYVLNISYPDALRKYLGVERIKETILSDSTRIVQLKEKAAQYYMNEEEMLQVEAERIFQKETEGSER